MQQITSTGIDYLRFAKEPRSKTRLPMRIKNRRPQSCVEIQARTRAIMRLKLAGMSNQEIAEMIGCTHATVSNVMNSPIVQEDFAKLQEAADLQATNARRELSEMLPKAIAIYREIMSEDSGSDDKTRLRAAQDVLDRVGIAKTTNIEGRVTHAHFTPADLDELCRRAADARRHSGSVITLTPQEA